MVAVRQAMKRIGMISLCYFVVVSLWWMREAGGPNVPSFGIVAVGLVFALANLVSLFVFIAIDDDRPDSHAYMAELIASAEGAHHDHPDRLCSAPAHRSL